MRDKTRELIELCPFRLDNVTEPFARPFVRSVGAFALGVRGGYARARNARARGEREANGQNGSKREGVGPVPGPRWADGPAPGISEVPPSSAPGADQGGPSPVRSTG